MGGGALIYFLSPIVIGFGSPPYPKPKIYHLSFILFHSYLFDIGRRLYKRISRLYKSLISLVLNNFDDIPL